MLYKVRYFFFTLFVFPLFSCSHVSLQASLEDFTDQVIEPLASRMAEEKFTAERAAIIAARTPTPPYSMAISFLGQVPLLGKLVQVGDRANKAQLEAELAWLETRRVPLKQELRDLFVARTFRTDDGFAFCAEGRQRRYRILEGARFSRLEDGSTCEMTALHSLRKSG